MKKSATLYRMHTDQHICPFGLRSLDLLKREGYRVEDIKLLSRQETDAFKQRYSVKTTPQTFIDDNRIGGYDDLRKFFNKPDIDSDKPSYAPVIAIFAVAFIMALSLVYAQYTSWNTQALIAIVEKFVAFSMLILAVQKLRDLYSFTNSFITYDLLAMRSIPYAYAYPFLEAFVGIGMLAKFSGFLLAPVSLFIGIVGAISVYKAVYIDKRELSCACVGGNSNVPLGLVSLTENLFMIAAGVWMGAMALQF